MAKININIGAAIATWNNHASTVNSNSTLVADLLDDTGAATGVTLRCPASSGGTFSDTAGRATSAHHGLPLEFWNGLFFNSSGSIALELSGLTPLIGQAYTIETAGFSKSGSARVMDFDIDGGTSQQYTSTTSEPPNAPLTFSGTIGADTLTLNSTLVTGLCVINGFTIDIGASDSIAPVDPVIDGSTGNLLNKSGFASGDLTGVTVDSVSVPFTQTTYDNFDIVAEASDTGTLGPILGSVVVEATNGTETANATISNNPRTGYVRSDQTAPDTVTPDALYTMMQVVGLTLSATDQFHYSNVDGSSIEPDGNWEFFTLPKTFQWFKNSESKWYELTMTTGGVVPGDGANRRYVKAQTTVITVTTGQLALDGVDVDTPCDFFKSPSGGVTCVPNGDFMSAIDTSGDELIIDGVSTMRPVNLYRSPNGELTTTPNGRPVATF